MPVLDHVPCLRAQHSCGGRQASGTPRAGPGGCAHMGWVCHVELLCLRVEGVPVLHEHPATARGARLGTAAWEVLRAGKAHMAGSRRRRGLGRLLATLHVLVGATGAELPAVFTHSCFCAVPRRARRTLEAHAHVAVGALPPAPASWMRGRGALWKISSPREQNQSRPTATLCALGSATAPAHATAARQR